MDEHKYKTHICVFPESTEKLLYSLFPFFSVSTVISWTLSSLLYSTAPSQKSLQLSPWRSVHFYTASFSSLLIDHSSLSQDSVNFHFITMTRILHNLQYVPGPEAGSQNRGLSWVWEWRRVTELFEEKFHTLKVQILGFTWIWICK